MVTGAIGRHWSLRAVYVMYMSWCDTGGSMSESLRHYSHKQVWSSSTGGIGPLP